MSRLRVFDSQSSQARLYRLIKKPDPRGFGLGGIMPKPIRMGGRKL